MLLFGGEEKEKESDGGRAAVEGMTERDWETEKQGREAQFYSYP